MAIRNKGYKFRLYPNKIQKEFLYQSFGSQRFVWNTLLDLNKTSYSVCGKFIFYNEMCKRLTELKSNEEFNFLNFVQAQSLQNTLYDLSETLSGFCKKENGFPKFKSKHYSNNSFTISNQLFEIDKIVNLCLSPPKQLEKTLKKKFKQNPIQISKKIKRSEIGKFLSKKETQITKINSITISKNKINQYFVSFSVEENINPLSKIDKEIGFDLGIKSLLVCSNGEVVENKRYYIKSEKKLKYLQKQFSKKKKGSKNREQSRVKLVKTHMKVSNQREDLLHKISKKLVNENQVIVSETLKVKNMSKNHKLSKHILDAGFGKLCQYIKYKAEWFGRTYHKINQFYPSSKICHCCGNVNNELTLKDRMWLCFDCFSWLDRDLNAALNILNQGRLELKAV